MNFFIGRLHVYSIYFAYFSIGYFKMYMGWREIHVVKLGWIRVSWRGKDVRDE